MVAVENVRVSGTQKRMDFHVRVVPFFDENYSFDARVMSHEPNLIEDLAAPVAQKIVNEKPRWLKKQQCHLIALDNGITAYILNFKND